jgi:hypothetical protein
MTDDAPWLMPAGRAKPFRVGWRHGFIAKMSANTWRRPWHRQQYDEGWERGCAAWLAWFELQRARPTRGA